MMKSTDNSLRFFIFKFNAGRSQERIVTWLMELSLQIKGKFKAGKGLPATKAIEHSQLTPQSSQWLSSEAAFPVSCLNCSPRLDG